MKKLITFLSVFLFIVLFAKPTNAARLYLDPADGNYGPGDSVEVNIRIDVVEACINTVEAELEFPKDNLEFKDFTTGDSILSIWVDKPATIDAKMINESGKVYFAGGIPGGYCGKIPGDPGDSNIIGRISFVVIKQPETTDKTGLIELKFTDNSHIYKNDGLGGEDTILKQTAKLQIGTEQVNKDFNWQSRIEADSIPPEPFVLELRHDKNIFNGAYYLTFSTVDKQTGVDHYEALELRANEQAGQKPDSYFWEKLLNKDREAPNWQLAKTPYVLNDQELLSVIKVKALDKAGNERVVEFVPETYKNIKPDNTSKIIVNVILLIIGLLLLILIFYLIKRRQKRKLALAKLISPTEE